MTPIAWISILLIVPSLCRDVAKFGPFGAHRGSGFPPPPSRPVPSFLSNSTDDVKTTYFDIMADNIQSISEKKINIEQLAAQNGLLEHYYQWEDQQNIMRHWLTEEVVKVLKQLSDVKTEIDRVTDDVEQTTKLQNKRLFDLNRKYPKEVAVLNFIINQVLTSAPRQGQFTVFRGQKTYGELDKVAMDGDKLPK